MSNARPHSAAPSPPPAQRWHRRLWRLAAALAAMGLAIAFLGPLVLSAGFVRDQIETELAAALGTEVRIASHDLSWFGELAVRGLEIDQPDGFGSGQVVSIRSAHIDVALLPLLGGWLDLEGTIEGVKVVVVQHADGRTSFDALGSGTRQVGGKDVPSPGSALPGPDLSAVRLDLEVVDGRIDVVHETRGVAESLRAMHVTLQKDYGGGDMRVELACEQPRPRGETPGKLGVEIDIDASGIRPLRARWSIANLDLARCQALLGLVTDPQGIEALAGIVTGSGRALLAQSSARLVLAGELAVQHPHVAGSLVAGMDIRSERWLLRPNITVAPGESGAPPLVDASELYLDLGILTAQGLTPSAAAVAAGGRPALGVELTVDVGKLAALGGPIPSSLRQLAGRLEGQVVLAGAHDLLDSALALDALAAQLAERIAAQCTLQLEPLEIEGHRLADIRASVTVARGTAHGELAAVVAGGALELEAELGELAAESWPASLALRWDGARVGVEVLPWLRYPIPLLAGLDLGAAAGVFESGLAVDLALSGPLRTAASSSVLGWASAWQGQGSLRLHDGKLQLAPALKPLTRLLQLAGADLNVLAFDTIKTSFQIGNGAIRTELLDLLSEAGPIVLIGRTGLDGSLDYRIDVSGALRGHSDGRRVLDALGGSVPEIVLSGTLEQPVLQMPDIAESLLQRGLQQGVQKLLREGLQELLEKRER